MSDTGLRPCVIVHYHEISLKRGNRPLFLRRLQENLARAVGDLGPVRVHQLPGRIVLDLTGHPAPGAVRERLDRVCGIANTALAVRTGSSLEALTRAVDHVIDGQAFASFRITARRAFKTFPMTSTDLNRELGAHVQRRRPEARVDLHHAALEIHVEVLPHEAFVYPDRCPGPGGLPVGSAGTVTALISGGIDSPVAAWRMMKRGCRVLFVHFHSVPYLPDASIRKVRELVGRLVRIAQALARQSGALALVTGESLGQVASQTLHNMARIDEAAELPILRPLIGMDKLEITDQARRLGTLETSNEPDADCCTLFVPAHPGTRLAQEEISAMEARLDVLKLVMAGVESASMETFDFPAGAGPFPGRSAQRERVAPPSVT